MRAPRPPRWRLRHGAAVLSLVVVILTVGPGAGTPRLADTVPAPLAAEPAAKVAGPPVSPVARTPQALGPGGPGTGSARIGTTGPSSVDRFPALAAAPPVAAASATAAAAAPAQLRNGSFDDGLAPWFASNFADHTTATVVDVAGDPQLEITVAATLGAVAQDVAITPQTGRSYSPSVRAVSPTGHPVLVQLAVHALAADGTIGESAGRFVVVGGHEVPITATLVPRADHASLRVEIYVHTVGRPVRLDGAGLAVDRGHGGPWNYGYQQPRVRYLDGVDHGALRPGEEYRVEVAVGTTTGQRWGCCDDVGAVRLGTEDGDLVGGSERASILHVPAQVAGSRWISPNRVALDQAETVVGATFTTAIQAPTDPGPFAERFRLVAEDVAWIPGPVIEIIGSVVEPPPVVDDAVTGVETGDPSGTASLPPGQQPTDPGLPLTEAVLPAIDRCGPDIESAVPTPGVCPPLPIDGPDCPTIGVVFEEPRLMRYPGTDQSDDVPVELACHHYELHLRSVDERHAAGYQADQLFESWYLEGLDGSGAVVYTSPATLDLAEEQTLAVTLVADADLADVVVLRARHVGLGATANSINASATLIPLS